MGSKAKRMQAPDIELLQQQIQIESGFVDKVRSYTSEHIVGQKHMIHRLIVGLLTKGHVLLEGLPGLAKTLAIKTIAQSIDATFQRIQFTPDLLPADIIGTMIYNPGTQSFNVRRGPIFANFVLADEINRAPAKVQSALLEAMQERQVTIGKDSYPLTEPFLVLATQNPIEQEGTYALPEAQVDRFMLKVVVDYPSREEEMQILRMNMDPNAFSQKPAVVSEEEVIKAREFVGKIYMDEKIEQYILNLVFATRDPSNYGMPQLKPLISYGASPRATIFLAKAAKAAAFLNKRAYVIPEDVREMSKDILRHRIGLTYEAEAENIDQTQIIDELMQRVEIP